MSEDSFEIVLDSTESYSTRASVSLRRKSSSVAGVSELKAIYPTSQIGLHDTIISLLSYVKHFSIPIFPLRLPDVRTVLGQGASFIVNGCELPKDYINPITQHVTPKGTIVAMKRCRLRRKMIRKVADRIAVIHNELLTLTHPPISAHPNIVNLLGIGFEVEGQHGNERALPTMIVEYAAFGNLADVLETARKEGRPMSFEQKMSLCVDVAHGLEILHACDIIHGDIKCENVLVFESQSDGYCTDFEGTSTVRKLPQILNVIDVRLRAKLTDFGATQLANGEFIIAGTQPWQAPEISRDTALRIDSAKKIDNFSFGMLLWRCSLDGDPFESLSEIQGTKEQRRTKRNSIIAEKKKSGTLISHVCASLACSNKFTELQLRKLFDVLNITLPTEAKDRELHISQAIRLLTPDAYFQERHPVPPSRMPANIRVDLVDFDKWYSEFEGLSIFIQSDIIADLRYFASSIYEPCSSKHDEERNIAAAYQLAICYANGFDGKFRPEESMKWLAMAAERGSLDACKALTQFQLAFPSLRSNLSSTHHRQLRISENNERELSSSWIVDLESINIDHSEEQPANRMTSEKISWLAAAQNGNYKILELLLSSGTKFSSSVDGVTPLHFLSSWELAKARHLSSKFAEAGANLDAVAAIGSTRGGTPLMWCLFDGRLEHARVLLDLGANPTTVVETMEESALSLAARLHLVGHLKLLIEYITTKELGNHLQRMLEAASSSDSRFNRIVRHGANWQSAATQTIHLLKSWSDVFTDVPTPGTSANSILHAGASSTFCRVNIDVLMGVIDAFNISPSDLQMLLRDSLLSYNKDLFERLLQHEVPVDGTFERGQNVLHLCARIPDDRVASLDFAPALLRLGIDVERRDETGLTPFMDAVLARKWDLADLLLANGANPLSSSKDGFNIMGLCIKTVNLGAIKYLLKYTGVKNIAENFVLVNEEKQISPLQLAASIRLPLAHGLKVEVLGTFLIILKYFGTDPSQVNFRSNGILPSATALEIAAASGVVHAVLHLIKKNGTSLPNREQILDSVKRNGEAHMDALQKTNLERALYIIENWKDKCDSVNELAADWTNLRTLDESNVASSWEHIVWDYSCRRRYIKGRNL